MKNELASAVLAFIHENSELSRPERHLGTSDIDREMALLIQGGHLTSQEAEFVRQVQCLSRQKKDTLESLLEGYATASLSTPVRFEIKFQDAGSIYDKYLQWTVIQVANLKLPDLPLTIEYDAQNEIQPTEKEIEEALINSLDSTLYDFEKISEQQRLEYEQALKRKHPRRKHQVIRASGRPNQFEQLRLFYLSQLPCKQCLWCGSLTIMEAGELVPFPDIWNFCHKEGCDTRSTNPNKHKGCCAAQWFEVSRRLRDKFTYLKTRAKHPSVEKAVQLLSDFCKEVYNLRKTSSNFARHHICTEADYPSRMKSLGFVGYK